MAGQAGLKVPSVLSVPLAPMVPMILSVPLAISVGLAKLGAWVALVLVAALANASQGMACAVVGIGGWYAAFLVQTPLMCLAVAEEGSWGVV